MGTTILFSAAAFLFFLAIEGILTMAFQAAGSTGTKRVLGAACRGILALCILIYLGLLGLFLFVGGNLLVEGETKKGISVLLSAAVVAVCVYLWLGRAWVRYLRDKCRVRRGCKKEENGGRTK